MKDKFDDGLCYDCPLHWKWINTASAPQELEFLYKLKDEVEDTLGNPIDILGRIRDVLYERIQIKEMSLWNI